MEKQHQNDWTNALQLIKLENDLIHHRSTTAFAVHGFLFAAFCAVAIKLNEKLDSNWNVLLIAIEFIIPVIGIYASCLLRSGMRAALRQIRACDVWFKRVTDCGPSQGLTSSDYPPLTGRRHVDEYSEFTPDERTKIFDISALCVGMDRLPNAMSSVWVVIVLMLTITLCIKDGFPYHFSLVALLVFVLYFSLSSSLFCHDGWWRSRKQDRFCTGEIMLNNNESREITKKWVRLVSACKLEKQWTNERLGWFFAASGVLLGALGAIVKIHYDKNIHTEESLQLVAQLSTEHVIGIIIVIGLASSISTFVIVVSAATMHQTWFGEMAKLIDNCNDRSLAASFTFGRTGRKCSWLARWIPISIPALMIIVWFFIACKVDLLNILKSFVS